jgi:hypothetical protein
MDSNNQQAESSAKTNVKFDSSLPIRHTTAALAVSPPLADAGLCSHRTFSQADDNKRWDQ